MYEQFGAAVDGQRVEFRLFFPDRAADPDAYRRGGLPRLARVQVTGTFQHHLGGVDWDVAGAPDLVLEPHARGILYRLAVPVDLPEGFYEYKYFVTFENGTTRWCTDPCTKYSGSGPENSGFAIGGHDEAVLPIANRLPQQDLVIYELMPDDFTAEIRGQDAPLDVVRQQIPYLLDLGVNAVEMMPWTAWPGEEFNWGYEPFQFFAVEHRYVNDPRTPEDKLVRLKRLVNALHERGLHVIMDGVFNHAAAGPEPGQGFGYYWLYQNPADSPFVGAFDRGGFFLELDFGNACTQEIVFDVCAYWLDEYQLDGIRFDYTVGYFRGDGARGDGVGPGITRLCEDVAAYCLDSGRENVSLMLEHLTDDRYRAIDDTNHTEATGCWYDRLLWESWDYIQWEGLDTRVMRALNAAKDFAPGKGPVTYVENHDHASLVVKAGGRSRWWRTQPFAIALLTIPGAVLIHNGQEFGEAYDMPEDGPDRVRPRPLHWQLSTDGIGVTMRRLYRTLIRLRREHPALRSPNFYPESYEPHFNAQGYGVDVDRDVVIYHRWGETANGDVSRYIVVLNFSTYDQHVDVPFPLNGEWRDLLTDRASSVTDFWLRHQRIESNWGRVYHFQHP